VCSTARSRSLLDYWDSAWTDVRAPKASFFLLLVYMGFRLFLFYPMCLGKGEKYGALEGESNAVSFHSLAVRCCVVVVAVSQDLLQRLFFFFCDMI